MSVPALVVAFGLPHDIELSIGGRLLLELPAPDGAQRRLRLADNSVTFKMILLNGTLNNLSLRGPSLGFELNLLAPSTDSDERTGFNAVAVFSDVWQRVLALHLNAAGGLSRAHRAFAFAGVALEGPWAWPLRPVLEATVRYDGGDDSVSRGFAAGILMPVNINLWFDVAARVSQSPAGDNTFEITGGVNWSFPDAGLFGAPN